MKWNRAEMERLAAKGDRRAAMFLVAHDAKKAHPGALRLVAALASMGTEQKAPARKSLAKIKARLMVDRGEACEVCAQRMPDPSLINAHHVVPVADGGGDEDSNIALVCPNCHAIAHWRYKTEGIPQSLREFLVIMREAWLTAA